MRNLLDMWRPERSMRELNALHRRMQNFFDDFPSFSSAPTEYRKEMDFVPACDWEETDKNYLISLEVPGVKKEDLEVKLCGDILTVSGEKKEERTEGKGARRAYERFHGRFERSFTLPNASETEKVEANYKDGVLSIAIPKSAAALSKTKRIQIGEGKDGAMGKSSQKAAEKAA